MDSDYDQIISGLESQFYQIEVQWKNYVILFLVVTFIAIIILHKYILSHTIPFLIFVLAITALIIYIYNSVLSSPRK